MICALCEKEKDQLYYARFRVGPIIDILPQIPEKPGTCQDCLMFFGKKLSKNRSYGKIGGGKFYVAPQASFRESVGEKLEADLLSRLAKEQEDHSLQQHLPQQPALHSNEESEVEPTPI